MPVDPIQQWFIRNIYAEGRSQSELARRLGVDVSMVNKIAKGRRGLKSREIPIAADYFGEAPPLPLPPQTARYGGRVEPGTYREPSTEQSKAPVAISVAPEEGDLVYFEFEGRSMEGLLPLPLWSGCQLIGRTIESLGHDFRFKDGQLVVVERSRDEWQTRERSVRQIELYPDRLELHLRPAAGHLDPLVTTHDLRPIGDQQMSVVALVHSATIALF